MYVLSLGVCLAKQVAKFSVCNQIQVDTVCDIAIASTH